MASRERKPGLVRFGEGAGGLAGWRACEWTREVSARHVVVARSRGIRSVISAVRAVVRRAASGIRSGRTAPSETPERAEDIWCAVGLGLLTLGTRSTATATSGERARARAEEQRESR